MIGEEERVFGGEETETWGFPRNLRNATVSVAETQEQRQQQGHHHGHHHQDAPSARAHAHLHVAISSAAISTRPTQVLPIMPVTLLRPRNTNTMGNLETTINSTSSTHPAHPARLVPFAPAPRIRMTPLSFALPLLIPQRAKQAEERVSREDQNTSSAPWRGTAAVPRLR